MCVSGALLIEMSIILVCFIYGQVLVVCLVLAGDHTQVNIGDGCVYNGVIKRHCWNFAHTCVCVGVCVWKRGIKMLISQIRTMVTSNLRILDCLCLFCDCISRFD